MDEQFVHDFVIASRRAQGLSDHVEADAPFDAVATILAAAASADEAV